MKAWGFKFKYSFKRTIKKIPSIAKDILAMVGVLLTVAEGASEIFDYSGIFECLRQNYLWIFLLVIVAAIILEWDRLEYSVVVEESPDIKITLKVCDVLSNSGAVIIPTNTTFDTTMEDDFISPASVQGQYQLRYYKDNLGGLNSVISDSLRNINYIKLSDGRKNKIFRYPIGTVARISNGKKRAYFLAEADINENGKPTNPDASDISAALVSLWERLSEIGNQEPYSIPLLGTGKAGVKNLSRNEIIKETVLSFLATTGSYKITENLIICVHPSDFEKINWDEICGYISYHCKYYCKEHNNKEKVIQKAEQTSFDNNIDIETREKRILSLLQNNPMSSMEIAENMGLSAVMTKRIVGRMVEDGLVTIEGTARNGRYRAIEK